MTYGHEYFTGNEQASGLALIVNKQEQREKIKRDVEKWLNDGNVVTELLPKKNNPNLGQFGDDDG